MKGHNWGLCKKCGKNHTHPRGMLGKSNPRAGTKKGYKQSEEHLRKRLESIRKYLNSEKGKTNLAKAQEMGLKTCKEKKKGFFDSKLQTELAKRSSKSERHYNSFLYFSREQQSELGLRSIVSHRQKYPYYINNVPFASELERQAMLILCKKFNIEPKERINCHIKMEGGEIDFRPTEKLFIEFHPWDRKGLNEQEYFLQRRKILDNNGYKDCEILIIKSLEELLDTSGGQYSHFY